MVPGNLDELPYTWKNQTRLHGMQVSTIGDSAAADEKMCIKGEERQSYE